MEGGSKVTPAAEAHVLNGIRYELPQMHQRDECVNILADAFMEEPLSKLCGV